MKTPDHVGRSYDFLQDLYLFCFGDYPDITAAFYNGNFSKSYEQAQRDKHDWILQGIGFKPDFRILDIGCGWGPLLYTIRRKGGSGVGITVSCKQAAYCQERGLDVLLQDWKEADPSLLGRFDAVVSVGAFEHFCSLYDHLQGEQEFIYRDFFAFCSHLLPKGGRLYLQTMTWGDHVPSYPGNFNIHAPIDSDERILGTLMLLSSWWPPTSKEQIIETASSNFSFIAGANGRDDYIRTFREAKRIWNAPRKGRFCMALKMLVQSLTNRQFWKSYSYFQEMIDRQYFREAFISHLLDHERMFFEKNT